MLRPSDIEMSIFVGQGYTDLSFTSNEVIATFRGLRQVRNLSHGDHHDNINARVWAGNPRSPKQGVQARSVFAYPIHPVLTPQNIICYSFTASGG